MVIAVELHEPKGFGRVRMRHVPNVQGTSLVPFVCAVVESASLIRTDGHNGYDALPSRGYRRKKFILSASDTPAHVSMPAVHRVASLLKRWLLGTHQGSVHTEHLQSYLEEFTFRFNRRRSRRRGLLFYRLLQQVLATPPAPYKDIIAKP